MSKRLLKKFQAPQLLPAGPGGSDSESGGSEEGVAVGRAAPFNPFDLLSDDEDAGASGAESK